nr:reverse transcriptase domain-containing protein [Tanacetum cinerariifolium]
MIPTTSSSLPLVVKCGTVATKDTMHSTNNGSTKDVQPLVVQTETLIQNSETVVAPIIDPISSPLRDKANDQREKIFQIFKDLNFSISFADALILMLKFGPPIKSLLTNKDKLYELARTPLNEYCLAVLLKKLPKKLGDPGKFLIPCDFNLGQFRTPIDVAEDVYVKVGKFHFLADFVVVDFDADSRVFKGALIAKTDKSSIDEPPEVKLKDLPPHLEYVFLEGDDKLPVIIAKDLSVEEKATLITVLKSHKRAIAWKLFDIKGIDPVFYTHKILIEDEFEPVAQYQRRVNPKIQDVIKQEVLKLLDAGLIYPISDSPWSSEGVYTARKPLTFSRLATIDQSGDIMAQTTLPRRNKYILMVVDYLSKWVEAKALPTNDARVACNLLKNLFARFGTPVPSSVIRERTSAMTSLQSELNELRDQAYENSLIYKEKTKRLHDSKIKDCVFNIGDRVLLFNSRLKIFSGKFKSRWSGPFIITHVFPYATIELSQTDRPNFKVNGHRLKHYFGEDIPKLVVPDLQTFSKDQ